MLDFFQPAVTKHYLQSEIGYLIQGKIDITYTKGFLVEEGRWINYRRNYFEVKCQVCLLSKLDKGSSKLYVNGSQVLGFRLAISAISDEGKDVCILQYTSRRGMGPKTIPPPVALQLQMGPVEQAFKRLQFDRATPKYNSNARPKGSYRLRVQLMADFLDSTSACVAEALSLLLDVRGRNPSFFTSSSAAENPISAHITNPHQS
ncbi:meiosis-specific transcription factor ndt80 [Entomophthora muscae]|uniref:Meiosis-specific transcription factor ndt80 n=1 Tax=Entomophthora muscae TaxID=34485 RepID=A0ACC2TUI9_9FUNG|nr:meiosis-specific transcription factor ndt80 [Entomophthora muscae]